jgi:glycosyltransferase involved in cell wall biosynthesis
MNKLEEIIILFPSFESGGATQNLINFINYCLKKNLKLTFISNLKKKNKFLKKRNIKLITLKNGFLSQYGGRYLSSFYSIVKLVSIINKKNSSNTVVFSFQSHILPILICRLFSKKIIIRNSEDAYEATKYADNKIAAYVSLFLKFIFYRFASGIITNSHKSKKSLQKIVKNKIELIFNPYLKNLYIFKIRKRKKNILSVGRLCKQKNQAVVIKAFKIFLKSFPEYKLMIVGHGTDYSKLKKLTLNLGIDNNVHFCGSIKNIKKFYLSSKIFVFPSLYEGLPNALIDSVNFNLPPISSRCSGADDILGKDYKNFVSRNNHKDLSQKMIKIINNYSTSLNQLQNARKQLNRFLIDGQSDKYLNFCNKIIQKK